MDIRFRHLGKYGDRRFSDLMVRNISAFINQAYLNAGAYTNIYVNTSGAFGGAADRMRLVNHPGYDTGQVWEGYRSNWVYEDSTTYTPSPISISGIYVNGVFQPSTGVGQYAHYIDYPYGRIVFESGINTSSTIHAEYSYKNVGVFTDDVPWAREFMFDSLRIDYDHFNQNGSGIWDRLAESRVQLPAIIIQPLSNVRLTGRELGGVNNRTQDIIFHVYAETPWEKSAIADDLINQKDLGLLGVDFDKVLESGLYPLDWRGSPNASGLDYAELVDDPHYVWRKMFVEDVSADEIPPVGRLYHVMVRWSVQTSL